MSSFHFPIILGKDKSERVVIIHLLDDDERKKKDYEENRIIIISSNDKETPLFRIPIDVNIISEYGKIDKSFFFEDKDKPSIHKKNGIESLQKIVITNEVGEKLKIKKNEYENYYEYYVNDSVFDGNIFFNIYIDEKMVSLSGSIHIIRPSILDKVLNINVDLGSDATQLTYFTAHSGTDRSNVNIIECFKKAYNNRNYYELQPPQNKDPLFIQQEKGQSYFYKTGNITFQDNGNIRQPITNSTSFINYLNISAAGKNEQNNNINDILAIENNYNKKLINIKLMYAYSDVLANFMNELGYHYKLGTEDKVVTEQDNLKQILFNIYKQIIKTSIAGIRQNKNNRSKYCSVLLLVPNIYNQQNIDGLLYELNKMNKTVRGVKYDFRVISESDSAFVGIKEIRGRGAQETILDILVKNIKEPKQKDMFLIIDAGKGTTDYSLIKYSTGDERQANNEMVSVERDGIVGAGGAIDYVFARILARQIYRHINDINDAVKLNNSAENHVDNTDKIDCQVDINEFTDRFMKMIEELPPLDQDRMMHLVEVLKKEYDAHNGKTAQLYSCFADNSAKGIIATLCDKNFNNDFETIKNTHGWKYVSSWNWDTRSFVEVEDKDKDEINWVCNEIATSIVDNKIFASNKDKKITNQIDFVIFNGRSFMFEPLKNAFESHISKYEGVWKENYKLLKWMFVLKPKKGLKKLLTQMNDENYLKQKLMPKDDPNNLRTANLEEYDLKSVSVGFNNHDLGVNCNSDLCCMDRLDYIQKSFDQKRFWQGFDSKISDDKNKKYYYIGYTGDHSFVPNDLYQTRKEINKKNVPQLLLMTLYPIKYCPIDFSKTGNKKTKKASSSNISDTNNSSITHRVGNANTNTRDNNKPVS